MQSPTIADFVRLTIAYFTHYIVNNIAIFHSVPTMTQALHQRIASFDLAGSWQTDMETQAVQQRIKALSQRYLSLEHLSDRLTDDSGKKKNGSTHPP